MVKKPKIKIKKRHGQQIAGLVFVLLVAGICIKLIFYSHAAAPSISVEAESGSVANPAQILTNDSTASGNSYVQFGSSSTGNGLYASDAFSRTVSNGWGNADIGGAWTQVKGSAANVSVNGSAAVFAIPDNQYTISDQIMELPNVSELNFTGSFDVSYMENVNSKNQACGGVNAYIAARIQSTTGTGYYRMGIAWDAATKHLWLRTQNAVGKNKGTNDFTIEKDTGINPANDFSAPPYSYHVKVNINGSNPTSFSSKVWKFGTSEPAGWMLTGKDTNNYGPQVAAPVGVRGVADLSSGSGCTTWLTSYTAHLQIDNLSIGP
jgi:hypothetical protein